MRIELVAALAANRTIGRDRRLPWRLPDDLRRFKQLTTGHTLLCGRKTFESIGRPLPERRTIVLTRNPEWRHEGVEVAHDLDAALALAADDERLFAIGGADVYALILPLAAVMHLTHVEAEVTGDVGFPEVEPADWVVAEEEQRPADERHAHARRFTTYERVWPAELTVREGDATRPAGRPAVIVHVCNDVGGWGAGFVLALSRRWPQPEAAYRAWHAGAAGAPCALGEAQLVEVEAGLWVANVVGQRGIRPGADGRPPVRYAAIERGLAEVGRQARERGASVHMPRIGCGLAGGRWEAIEPIVERRLLGAGVDVTVYDWGD